MSEKETLSSQEMLKAERYLWISRAFSAVAVLAFVANVILFSAIGALYPLVRIQPFYLNILDKNQQVIDITPVTTEELQSTAVIEALVRQYVLAHYEVGHDVQEVEDRWGPDGIVALMSSADVYDQFWKNSSPLLEEVKDDGLTMEAFITSAIQLGSPFVWRVNVRLREMRQNSREPTEIKLVVDVTVQFDPLMKQAFRTTWQDRLKNPLGFRVITYGSEVQ